MSSSVSDYHGSRSYSFLSVKCNNLFSDIYDLFDVKSEVLQVAPNWRGVGDFLRLNPALLATIKADNPTSVQQCLNEVLTQWLQKAYNTDRFGPPSWKLLVAAVAHPAGGNNRALAEKIAEKHNGKCKPEG